MGDDKVPFQPKYSTNLQGNPPSSGKSQDQIFQSVTMPGSKIAREVHVKNYEIISSAWEVHQATLALPVSHRPQDLECWEQNRIRNAQKGFRVNVTLLRRKRGKKNPKTLMAFNLFFQHGKSQFADFLWTCWEAWRTQPAQQAQGGEWQELLQVRTKVPEQSCVGGKAWSGRRAEASERTGAGRD